MPPAGWHTATRPAQRWYRHRHGAGLGMYRKPPGRCLGAYQAELPRRCRQYEGRWLRLGCALWRYLGCSLRLRLGCLQAAAVAAGGGCAMWVCNVGRSGACTPASDATVQCICLRLFPLQTRREASARVIKRATFHCVGEASTCSACCRLMQTEHFSSVHCTGWVTLVPL